MTSRLGNLRPCGSLGERRRGVAAALPELAIRRTTDVLTQTPQVNGELDKSGPIELQRSLRSWHLMSLLGFVLSGAPLSGA